MSFADTFITIPDSKFFLRHVVMINYGGKVYTVLRGIEMLDTNLSTDTWWLFALYSIFMVLGMYWYTRFWLLPNDLDAYYGNGKHVLNKVGPFWITLGAAAYYLLFGILFAMVYTRDHLSTALSFAMWNFWCFINLLLATPLFK